MQVNSSLAKAALLSVLRQKRIDETKVTLANSRTILGDLLISSNDHWKEETLELIDQLYKSEKKNVNRTIPVTDILISTVFRGTRISLWQGDITTLAGNDLAVVNAANEQGVGCFQPEHRCIDNVIHRGAGPRLRMECEKVMEDRGRPLAAGSEAIVTGAYHLPSKHVIHVTGPQVAREHQNVSESDRVLLSKAYENSLNAAVGVGAKQVAFPCISTGLFGFPADAASNIALATVEDWLQSHPNELDSIVFNTFAANDTTLYEQRIGYYFQNHGCPDANDVDKEIDDRDMAIRLAKQWIDDADAVLICAGAGMSVKPGEMVYTNQDDFAAAYPWFTRWGYKTGYEGMGLFNDKTTPETAKWAYHAKHMDNMRWSFTPNDGYKTLADLVKGKDHFVLTSNVDACFERAGFDPSRIYTPQGEWTYLQCMSKCQPDSVFPARPYLDAMLPNISKDGFIPKELIPKCPRCGSGMFGNVRGGSWFLHHKYEAQSNAIQAWMHRHIDSGSKVAIIEVGAGFNTPTVTRFPMESFVRSLGDRGSLIRVNPTDPEVPEDLLAVALAEGWQVLNEIKDSRGVESDRLGAAQAQTRAALAAADLHVPIHQIRGYARHFGHMDWQTFLGQLKDDN